MVNVWVFFIIIIFIRAVEKFWKRNSDTASTISSQTLCVCDNESDIHNISGCLAAKGSSGFTSQSLTLSAAEQEVHSGFIGAFSMKTAAWLLVEVITTVKLQAIKPKHEVIRTWNGLGNRKHWAELRGQVRTIWLLLHTVVCKKLGTSDQHAFNNEHLSEEKLTWPLNSTKY